jgi:glycosyltransferase involved in cell wall biosynthesis
MSEVDILAEQFIVTCFGLSAIEGMASGLPVMANLENEAYTRVFRRYAFLNECPVLSSSPENLKGNLRLLVTRPELRRELGQAGRKYVEKYHSYETAQYLFGSIYDRILHGKEVDLINLFHPLTSAYCRAKPMIQHPLIENRIPQEGRTKC